MEKPVVVVVDPDAQRRVVRAERLERLPAEVFQAVGNLDAIRLVDSKNPLVVVCSTSLDGGARGLLEFLEEFVEPRPARLLLDDGGHEGAIGHAVAAADACLGPDQFEAIETVVKLLVRLARAEWTLSEQKRKTARSISAGEQPPDFTTFRHLVLHELKKAHRYGYPISVVLVAIDRYRQLAQWLEPQRRARFVRAVWKAVVREARDCDLSLQFADDKLLLVLSHTSTGGAAKLAERLRERISDIPPPPSLVKLRLTTTIAVAGSTGNDQLSLGALLGQVSRAVRQMQQQGGDAVVVCSAVEQKLAARAGKLGDRICIL